MPSGGARKGAGRKPKPLAEKLAAGNPGHRPLKKVEFGGADVDSNQPPPDYLRLMVKPSSSLPSPMEIYGETVRYLEPSECLPLIAPALIADYAMAKYFLMNAQYELTRTATVAKNEKGEVVVTSFTEAMLKMQKNVITAWTPIWDIVSRNSERIVQNPEQDLVMAILSGKVRKKRPKGDAPDDGANGHSPDAAGSTEPGEV